MHLLMSATAALLALVSAHGAQARECKATDFGAVANDELSDTAAIQRAIDTCAAAGGGRVVLTNGRFVSGTLFLKSHIDLHLERGAVLLGSPRLADYAPSQEATGSHAEGKRDGLIIATKASNVAITGAGTVDGNGESFWDAGFLASGKSRPTLPRPMPWVEFRDSNRITVRDTTFQNSPSYGVAFTRSQDVHVENIRVLADPRSPNTDGIQVNDSQRVTIRAVHVATGDDNIVLKSDNGDVEDVVVSDSVLTSDDTAFKLGTSSSKAIRRITLRDTTMINSRIGIGLFMRRGGVYEDVAIHNVRFTGRSRSNMEWPIYIDIDRRAASNSLGAIRDIRIEGMRIEGRGNVLITGNPEAPLENITLRDIEFTVSEPSELSKLNKPRGNVTAGVVPGSVDHSQEPSHLTFGHVRNLVVQGLRVQGKPAAVGARRAITLLDVADARLSHIDVADIGPASAANTTVLVRQAGAVLLGDVRVRGNNAAPQVRVEGQRSGAVLLCRHAFAECGATAPSP